MLPRHSVPAGLLWRLLTDLLAGAAVKTAAEALHAPFALETFYRLRQRLRQHLAALRTCLCRSEKVPLSAQTDPLLHSVEHFRAAFPAGLCPLAAFQLRFQRPLLG